MAHTDIDECSEGISGCSHLCSNTIVGYSCNCQNGYQVDSDNHTCLGNFINVLLMIDIAYFDDTDINESANHNGECEQNCQTQLVAILVLVWMDT